MSETFLRVPSVVLDFFVAFFVMTTPFFSAGARVPDVDLLDNPDAGSSEERNRALFHIGSDVGMRKSW